MNLKGLLSAVAFTACVPMANWMVENVGVCSIEGPCVVPVWPGLWAPSAVLVAGLALVLRDVVHAEWGPVKAAGLIVLGAILSFYVASPQLAVASAVAFLVAEMVDFGVYAPIYRRWPARAVLLSGLAGATVDSVLFLSLAFGDLSFLPAQLVGKMWASVLAAIAIRFLAFRHVTRG